jgi:hypothetical protein
MNLKISVKDFKSLIREIAIAEKKRQKLGNKIEWTVEEAGKLHKDSKLFGIMTHDLQKRDLNIPLLVRAGALYITEAHDEPLKNNPDYLNNPDGIKQIEAQDPKGWIVLPEEAWLFSVISYWNTLQGDWAADAKNYKKPASYSEAAEYIKNEIYDGKYLQILWSASKKGLTSDQVFL